MKFKYSAIVALGAISYGGLTSFAKLSYGQGYSVAEITFAQAGFGALILWILSIAQLYLQKKNVIHTSWKVLLSGTSVGLSAYCFYFSVKFIPVSLAIVLLMQVSWMSSLIEWIIFKKKMGRNEIIASAVIIIGTLLASGVVGNVSYFSFKGVGFALLAALIYSFYVISSSRFAVEIPMLQKSALMMTGSALIILTTNIKSITSSIHLDFGLVKWGILLAVFGTVIPPICFNTGMPKIGSGISAILLTLELPAVVLCAYFILGEQITGMQLLGIMIMLVAIVGLNISAQKQISVATADVNAIK